MKEDEAIIYTNKCRADAKQAKQNKKYDDAIRHFKQAIKIADTICTSLQDSKEYSEDHFQLALCYINRRLYDDARKHLETAKSIAAKQKNENLLNDINNELDKLNSLSSKQSKRSSATSSAQKDIRKQFNTAYTEADKLVKNKPTDALKLLDGAITIAKSNPNDTYLQKNLGGAYFLKAHCFYKLKKLNEAILEIRLSELEYTQLDSDTWKQKALVKFLRWSVERDKQLISIATESFTHASIDQQSNFNQQLNIACSGRAKPITKFPIYMRLTPEQAKSILIGTELESIKDQPFLDDMTFEDYFVAQQIYFDCQALNLIEQTLRNTQSKQQSFGLTGTLKGEFILHMIQIIGDFTSIFCHRGHPGGQFRGDNTETGVPIEQIIAKYDSFLNEFIRLLAEQPNPIVIAQHICTIIKIEPFKTMHDYLANHLINMTLMLHGLPPIKLLDDRNTFNKLARVGGNELDQFIKRQLMRSIAIYDDKDNESSQQLLAEKNPSIAVPLANCSMIFTISTFYILRTTNPEPKADDNDNTSNRKTQKPQVTIIDRDFFCNYSVDQQNTNNDFDLTKLLYCLRMWAIFLLQSSQRDPTSLPLIANINFACANKALMLNNRVAAYYFFTHARNLMLQVNESIPMLLVTGTPAQLLILEQTIKSSLKKQEKLEAELEDMAEKPPFKQIYQRSESTDEAQTNTSQNNFS